MLLTPPKTFPLMHKATPVTCRAFGSLGGRVDQAKPATMIRVLSGGIEFFNAVSVFETTETNAKEKAKLLQTPSTTLPVSVDRAAATNARKALFETKGPVVIAADPQTTMDSLHRLLGSLLTDCGPDETCGSSQIGVPVLLATCIQQSPAAAP